MRWIALCALIATACRGPVETVPEQDSPRLMQGCGEAGRLLGQMSAAEGSFRYDNEGNVQIRDDLWNSLPRGMQDGLIKAIAYQAICESGEAGEQIVTVRSSQDSRILAQQTVTDFDR